MFWLEGSLRLMPHLESRFLGHTVPWNVFFPAVALPLLCFGALYIYPFVERRLTRDHEPHELLDRPRYHPVRTGIGVAAMTFFVVLSVAGANDLVPYTFGMNMMVFTWAMRVLVILLPLAAFEFTRRFCHRLQWAVDQVDRAPPEDADLVLVDETGYAVAPHREAHKTPSG
jgi:ubiquinol-cytochrome c reductase cytochrome b subunit